MKVCKEFKKETERLANWIQTLMDKVENKEEVVVEWFNFETEEVLPYHIIAGWAEGYADNLSDILFIDNNKAFSIKLIPNYNYDLHTFESLSMPVDKSGEAEYICMALEKVDDPTMLAEFFLGELDRLIKEYHIK